VAFSGSGDRNSQRAPLLRGTMRLGVGHLGVGHLGVGLMGVGLMAYDRELPRIKIVELCCWASNRLAVTTTGLRRHNFSGNCFVPADRVGRKGEAGSEIDREGRQAESRGNGIEFRRD